MDIHGILPVNKPAGLSSFDLIRIFKRDSGFTGKIGHGGTLDVFADGVVLLLLGKATKQFDAMLEHAKSYRAGVRLGCSSTTLDIEGVFTALEPTQIPKRDEIRTVLPSFLGEIEQAVPAYSAAKQGGQPLYKLARKGQVIQPKSKLVTVHELELVAYKYPLATIDVSCGSGTYVRQLTYDIFRSMQIESFLFSLQRTKVGEITIQQCAQISDFSESRWLDFVLGNNQ